MSLLSEKTGKSKTENAIWIRDASENVFTPGGDAVWICPVCGKGRHVYGVESFDGPQHICPDCGTKLRYPWETDDQHD